MGWPTVVDRAGALFNPEMAIVASGIPPRRKRVILLYASSVLIPTGTGSVDIVTVHPVDLLRNRGDHLSNRVLITTGE